MTRAGYSEASPQQPVKTAHRKAESLARRPALTSPGGNAIYAIEVFEPELLVTVGDGPFDWPIPEDLDGAVLLKVEGAVTFASSSGSIQVQLSKRTGSGTVVGELLTEMITIEPGDLNSKDAATQPEVDTGSIAEFVWGDHIRVDVVGAGTDAMGLHVIGYFFPAVTASVAIEGATGPPGGVTSWQGQWTTSTGYTTGQSVSNNGTSYVARDDHTSGATSEPGVGVDWEDHWQVLAERQQFTALTVLDNNQGRILDIGDKAIVPVPFEATIVEWTLVADLVGSMVIDIRKDSYANYPPTSGDSIVAASPPQLSSQQKAVDTALAGWTTAIAEDDVLIFTVTSVSVVTFFALTLKLERP